MNTEELIGQEVESVAVFPSRWRIADVYQGVDGILYARLRRRGEEASIKTLALRTIMDRRHWNWRDRKPR